MKGSSMQAAFISAIVMIPRDSSFDQFAERLNHATGMSFLEEVNGRYDELPAYEARVGEFDALLLGPEDDGDDEYRLELSCTTETPVEKLAGESSGFVRLFMRDKPLNSIGYLDLSQELAEALAILGIPNCRPITATD